jgi:hypothetical protein
VGRGLCGAKGDSTSSLKLAKQTRYATGLDLRKTDHPRCAMPRRRREPIDDLIDALTAMRRLRGVNDRPYLPNTGTVVTIGRRKEFLTDTGMQPRATVSPTAAGFVPPRRRR